MVLNLNADLQKYKKFAIGGGVMTILGTLFYEYYRIKKTLSELVNTEVLDIDKKRPDYIYIKYSIYRESMDQIRSMEEQDKNWVNVIVHPFGKWWKTIKHSVAWRLLEISKTGDLYDRLKAVHQLARIDNLKDWDYQHLAQICDYRTAISLARNFCDVRWFSLPYAHGATREPKSLIYDLRQHLNTVQTNPCVRHFYGTLLNRFTILSNYEYNQTYFTEPCYIPKQDTEFFKQLLEVLFHITKNGQIIQELINSGILPTLMEIQKLFKHNADMTFLLSKVLANMSMCHEFGYDFFVTGWVGMLARWSRHQDLRVQVTAAKALANMDMDDNLTIRYQPRIYPLYPRARVRQKSNVDIVFVHGLLGGVFITWRQKDREEPQLGLYGKNALFTDDPDDMFMVGNTNSNSYDKNNNKNNKTISNSSTKKRESDNNVKSTDTKNKSEAVMYVDNPLIGKKSAKHLETVISDQATKELVETLNTAIEIEPDWEVVFPDCPIEAKSNSMGPFSVSGDKWINDDKNEEYTYCWPMDWLPNDYPNIRVIGVNYETNLTEWSSNKNQNCPCEKKGTIHNRAEEMLNSLVASGVGKECPVIWVGHSMGGLLLKSIIVQALESQDPHTKLLALNTQGIMFLGTPHKGSPVAKLKQHIQYILSPTIEVKELEENAAYLLNLHEKFLDYLDSNKDNVQIVSIAEGIPTVLTAFKFPVHVVTKDSAKLQFGDYYVLNVDHLGLSKPFFRQSFLYQRLLRIIDAIVKKQEK